MALLGKRAPASLKPLLTTVAIVDDMAAVVVIAVIRTAGIGWGWLAAAGGVLAVGRLSGVAAGHVTPARRPG